MNWQTIATYILDLLRQFVTMISVFSWLIVLIAAINWTFGGWPVLRRKVVIRQSWPFVAMRWLGLLAWLGTLSRWPFWNPVPDWLAAVHCLLAVVMLVGTARKPLRERFIDTPGSEKHLSSDPP